MSTGSPSVALAADYLTQRGGAERVVLAMSAAFPEAGILAAAYDPESTYPEFADRRITTLWPDRIGAFRSDPRRAFPVLAPTWSRALVDADVTVVSSSGWAHGVRTTGRKIVYCHNPARWLYQRDDYFQGFDGVMRALRPASAPVAPLLRRWDRKGARDADLYLVNSTSVRRRVREVYGIEAEVLHPPVMLRPDDAQEPIPGIEPGFLLTVSRARGYKNAALLAEAVSSLPDTRLVVVGEPPEGVDPRRVQAVSGISDAQLTWLYANAEALLAASHEDFGLTPVEANTFGTPVVALRFGGYLDSVAEGVNGVFFDTESASSVRAGIVELRRLGLDRDRVADHARRFALGPFVARLRELAT